MSVSVVVRVPVTVVVVVAVKDVVASVVLVGFPVLLEVVLAAVVVV